MPFKTETRAKIRTGIPTRSSTNRPSFRWPVFLFSQTLQIVRNHLPNLPINQRVKPPKNAILFQLQDYAHLLTSSGEERGIVCGVSVRRFLLKGSMQNMWISIVLIVLVIVVGLIAGRRLSTPGPQRRAVYSAFATLAVLAIWFFLFVTFSPANGSCRSSRSLASSFPSASTWALRAAAKKKRRNRLRISLPASLSRFLGRRSRPRRKPPNQQSRQLPSSKHRNLLRQALLQLRQQLKHPLLRKQPKQLRKTKRLKRRRSLRKRPLQRQQYPARLLRRHLNLNLKQPSLNLNLQPSRSLSQLLKKRSKRKKLLGQNPLCQSPRQKVSSLSLRRNLSRSLFCLRKSSMILRRAKSALSNSQRTKLPLLKLPLKQLTCKPLQRPISISWSIKLLPKNSMILESS